ncbi:MAG: phage tail sheath family protein [Bacteroidia bacterium]
MPITSIKTPGVYIDEVSTIPPSIAPVSTAIPAFVGHTQTTVINGIDWWVGGPATVPAPAVRITSLLEYQTTFGSAFPEIFNISIVDTPATGTVVSRAINLTQTGPSDYNLYYSLQSYFANGGGPCYIVSIGNYSTATTSTGINLGIDSLEKEDEPTLILFPDAVSLSMANYGAVVQQALMHCSIMQDRFTIMDQPADTIASVNAVGGFREKIGIDNLKYGAAYMPFLNTLLNFNIDQVGSTITSYIGSDPTLAPGITLTSLSTANPAVYANIISQINNTFFVTLPPSPAMAGIYATVDSTRGVWKAPANVGVTGIVGPTLNITSAQQEDLNVDPASGKSINVIRAFTGRGILVWGARTLAGNDNEWRYVPVRRLFIMVEESVKDATQFVVFESNTANTWQRVKGMIEAFLTNLWRDGALAGATTKDAFFVNVGLGTTMTADDILNGRMIVEIGMAAVRPAEFIVLKFEHKLQVS